MKLFTTANGKNLFFTFVLVCTLFLLWGFCSGLLDNLNKHFQNALHISKFQSGFVQNAFYMGYFLMAIPAGVIARKFGYKGGIIVGLTLTALGAFWFIPATQINTYGAFLAGLFLLATGLACLETIANPYTTVLGPVESGATRINIAQTCNGVGWVCGMLIGSMIILSATQEVNASNSRLYIPYLGVGIAVVILLVFFIFANVPDIHPVDEVKSEAEGLSKKPIVSRLHFVFGVVAQFLYVAAQTGIFSFFINYSVVNVNGLSDQSAGKLQTLAFGLFAFGRLTGSALVGFMPPQKVLATYAGINGILMVAAMITGGWTGVICLMASFFLMSIMFPTIFALSIRGLGEHTKLGASILVMSVVGGAIMTPLMGLIADKCDMRVGFIVPTICFAVIFVYGLMWRMLERRDSGNGSSEPVVIRPVH